MKRTAILAALALALVLVAVEGAAAGCVATNCAIDEQQRATTPAQGSTSTQGRDDPKLENVNRLPNLTHDCSAPLQVDRCEAVQLAICRACSSSNLTGLLYPSAE